MWQNFSFVKKLMICFLIFIIAIIGSDLYFNKTLINLQDTINILEKYDDIRPSFKQREIEHMQWAQQLILFVFLQNNTELALQVHPSRCELGKWLASSERRQVKEMVPDLDEILNRIEVPHQRLHQSAVTIRRFAAEHDWEGARRIVYGETLPSLEEIRMLLGLGTTEIGKAVSEMRRRADSDRKHSVLISRLVMGLGTGIGLLCFMALLLSVVRPSRKS